MRGCATQLGTLLLVCLLALLAVVLPAAAQDDAERKLEDTPRLTVRGEAEIVQPADELRISIGVTSEAAKAQPALSDNNGRMAKVVAALKQAGLTEDEYETGRFRIRPTYEPRPRTAPGDWKPRINGYEVVNTLTLRTKKLDQAGLLIQVANDAGADTIDGITFGLSEARAYREEAVVQAVHNAMEDASWMAEAAGIELVRVVAMSLGTDRPEMGVMDGAVRAMAASELSGTTPIAPGDVTIRASVTMSWEIGSPPDPD